MNGLQPTKFTLFHMLWLMAILVGGVNGLAFGHQQFGKIGAVCGALIGLYGGHVIGRLPEWLNTRWFFRKITRSSNDELWKIVNMGFWNFCNTMALLQLAARGVDVRGQIPRIMRMLESEEELTRVYGWDALRLVFNDETKAIGEYNPRASTEDC